MKFRSGVVLVYGLLVLIGGIMGFIKADSMPSLIMGGAFGLLIIASAIAMAKGHKFGTISAIAISGILSVFFAFRFIKTEIFMPSGLMALLSILVLLTLVCSFCKKCSSCSTTCHPKDPNNKT